jgi:hypothetical protein
LSYHEKIPGIWLTRYLLAGNLINIFGHHEHICITALRRRWGGAIMSAFLVDHGRRAADILASRPRDDIMNRIQPDTCSLFVFASAARQTACLADVYPFAHARETLRNKPSPEGVPGERPSCLQKLTRTVHRSLATSKGRCSLLSTYRPPALCIVAWSQSRPRTAALCGCERRCCL